MQIIPLHTRLICPGDSLADLLHASSEIQNKDILVISSKVIAVCEQVAVDLSTLTPSAEAHEWSTKTGRSPEFMEAVILETKRMNGSIIGSCPGALLTELRPSGLSTGTIFAPNAGMDESNIQRGWAVGWPHNPVKSATELQHSLGGTVGILISDSCCTPRRHGVTAFALAVAGFDPLQSEIGKHDLFGRTMHVTIEAVADQLATAGNMVMGNTNQSIPAAIIRDHGLSISDYCGWVKAIEPADDLFSAIL